jgi:Uma2 family endonuclease
MTAEEFRGYAAKQGGRCELFRGEVRSLSPSGGTHGKLTARLAYILGRYVEDHHAGIILGAETGFRLDDQGEPTVRAPDVAFVAIDRARQADTPKFIPIAPDLVAEVLSPDDRATEVAEKVTWWIEHGVRLVWVVDPENRSVAVHLPNGQSQRLRTSDKLGGGEVLPGFELMLTELFR